MTEGNDSEVIETLETDLKEILWVRKLECESLYLESLSSDSLSLRIVLLCFEDTEELSLSYFRLLSPVTEEGR